MQIPLARLRRLLLPTLAAVTFSTAPFTVAADNTEAFEAKIKSGFEVGMVLEKTKSRDGQVAIIWAARKKALKPANWPVLMTDFHYIGTVAEGEGDGFTSENWIVSLAAKKRLAVVKWEGDEDSPFHPDDHRSDLSAAWTTDAGGARLGLMVFSSDNKSYGAQLVRIENGAVRTTHVLGLFDNAANQFTSRHKTWNRNKTYLVRYSVDKAGLEERSLAPGGTAFYQIGFTSSVDRDRASTPDIRGTIHLRVTSKPDGAMETEIVRTTLPGVVVDYGLAALAAPKPETKLTAPKTATTATLPSTAPTTLAEFANLRITYNKITDGDDWKFVDRELPKETKGQRHYVRGWLVGSDLRMLMHVNAATKEDQTIVFYYYFNGALVSVFERRKGANTEISEVGDASETYNFIQEKLVSWKRLPIEGGGDGYVSPKDDLFADKGRQMLKDAIKLAQPILQAIKAN